MKICTTCGDELHETEIEDGTCLSCHEDEIEEAHARSFPEHPDFDLTGEG